MIAYAYILSSRLNIIINNLMAIVYVHLMRVVECVFDLSTGDLFLT